MENTFSLIRYFQNIRENFDNLDVIETFGVNEALTYSADPLDIDYLENIKNNYESTNGYEYDENAVDEDPTTPPSTVPPTTAPPSTVPPATASLPTTIPGTLAPPVTLPEDTPAKDLPQQTLPGQCSSKDLLDFDCYKNLKILLWFLLIIVTIVIISFLVYLVNKLVKINNNSGTSVKTSSMPNVPYPMPVIVADSPEPKPFLNRLFGWGNKETTQPTITKNSKPSKSMTKSSSKK